MGDYANNIVEVLNDDLVIMKTRYFSRQIEAVFMDAQHIVFSFKNQKSGVFQIYNSNFDMESEVSLGQDSNPELPFYMPSSNFQPYYNVSILIKYSKITKYL
jgi:hypothetical protein